MKELCKAAAYGPIRDLLRDEQKARVEKSTRRVEKAVVNVKGLGGGYIRLEKQLVDKPGQKPTPWSGRGWMTWTAMTFSTTRTRRRTFL